MATEIKVNGMSCVNCVRHVTEALEKLPGVKDVKADLESGKVTFEKPDTVAMDEVDAAVREAGYQVLK